MIIEGSLTGAINCDIKPTNIFLNEDQKGKWNRKDLVLADYGIGGAGFVDHGCGTGGFASPEQMVTTVVQSGDVYSIGKGLFN